MPRAFRRKDITYSRLGMEDFDFAKHNRTRFAGLEAHTPNSYINGLLQVCVWSGLVAHLLLVASHYYLQAWYYITPLRAMLLEHLCTKDHCLACELAFLFHMLDRMCLHSSCSRLGVG